MDNQEQLAFRALADPTRRGILHILAERQLTIAEVAENFEMTRVAVKKHLRILEEGDLIIVKKVGRARINQLNAQGMKSVRDWLSFFDAFWDDRLAALKSEIEGSNDA